MLPEHTWFMHASSKFTVRATDTQGGSVGLMLKPGKQLLAGRKKVVLFCFRFQQDRIPASLLQKYWGKIKMCAAPQTAHKSADLAMRSHGVLNSNPLSTQPTVIYYTIIAFLEHSSYVDSSALNPILSVFILHLFCNEQGKVWILHGSVIVQYERMELLDLVYYI